jgi:proteasome lid subunit RPN8/RPN11
MADGILIDASALADMIAHARAEAPRECCGLLIGTRDAVVRSFRAKNLAPAVTRYFIDPHDHFRALRLARTESLQVIGAYHSHPAGDPVPSATDIAEANSGSEFVYVIVSLVKDEVRAYRIDGGTYELLTLNPDPRR